MKQALFEQMHRSDWEVFEHWIEARGKLRKHKSAAAKILPEGEVPHAYRRICQLLALARDRQYSPVLVDRLNRIALQGHHVLYGARGGQRAKVGVFLVAGFPQLVREHWQFVAASALLFFGPLIAMIAVLQWHPDFVHYFADAHELAAYDEMYDPANSRIGQRASDDNLMMFAYYIWHNVKIGFQTFATGLLFGLGTVFFLFFNGLSIGTIAGYITAIGHGVPFWSFVSGHSAMELGAIVISGAAGIKLGTALIAPGARSRSRALVEESKPAVRLMYGAALMFMIAAFIEGFWSPLAFIEPVVKYSVGASLWAILLIYFLFVGRSNAA
jgi:uncharacterized membrane protein SpoIIM required for sporulation